MRIIFFGTPQFAVPSLRALVTGGLDVAGVVTQPDRPRGRSRSRLIASPIKSMAEDLGLPVYQPDRPVGDVFEQTVRRLQSEIGVVVAYGHILRPEILAVPRLGMINVHASLLPKLRGPAPIQWSILNGDEETGISIMQMEAGLDSGPVIHRARAPVQADETAGELTERLAALGASTLVEALQLIEEGKAPAVVQDHGAATYAPKIDHAACRLNWNDTATQCARVIRAFDPDPGAWSMLRGTEVKFFGSRKASLLDTGSRQEGAAPGTVLQAGERLAVAAGDGPVLIREAQPAGRRRMAAADWVRGRGAGPGDRFE